MNESMSTTKLELHGLSKTYSSKGAAAKVIENVTLTASEGEFVSIIGPSGCGKSTLFHIIGGITEPTAGKVMLDGKEITGSKGLISYMPQQPALFPWRTILDNVIMGQELAGSPKKEAREAAREWLAKAGLQGYEKAYPHMLSGGMQQRAAFIRALLSPREVMCLDEPFGALDALTRQDMQSWLLDIWENNKRTVLFITHSIEEALFLSDKIVLLSRKPTHVLKELVVPLPRPRQEEVVNDPVFLELKQHIYGLMKQEQRHN